MHEVIEIIQNDGAGDLSVAIEPWGMPLRLAAGHAFRVVARGPTPGQLEVVRRPGAITVYAWPGATAEVFDGEQLVERFSQPVPAVPPGQTVRAFFGLLGLDSDRRNHGVDRP